MLQRIEEAVWGLPMIALVLLCGVCLTVRTRGVQLRRLGEALRLLRADGSGGGGEVSAFGALCTALSATIGTGNIIGTAMAVTAGGPGALFWMVAAALLGMAVKYAECLLAVRYRLRDADGPHGGPFLVIERGMGRRFRPLAKAFALCGTLAGFLGIGTMTQTGGIVQAASAVVDPAGTHGTLVAAVVGGIVTVLAGAVLLGGIRRIAAVSEVVVPFMAGAYLLLIAAILVRSAAALPGAVRLIVRSAFAPRAVLGAGSGIGLSLAVRTGVERGIFSNESGLGSAPIAAAAAHGDDAVRQGLIAMTGTFFDTVVLCSLTGLAFVVTDAWRLTGLDGTAVARAAFADGLPLPDAVSAALLALCLAFFAFTTIVGWQYYAEQCLLYLCGRRRIVRAARWVYLLFVLAGAFVPVGAVWHIAGIANGLMAFPNMLALLWLSPEVGQLTRAAERENPTRQRPHR